MRGRVILSLGGILLAGAVVALLALLGLPPLFVISWMLLILGIGIVTRELIIDDGEIWPPERPKRTRQSDVSRLAWAINTTTGMVGPALVRRVRAVVAHRLALRGLDLDDGDHGHRIDELLGSDIRSILDARAIHRDDLDRVLDAIDTLPPTLGRA